MKTPEEAVSSLAQIEAEVMAEGREWMRKRMAARLQQLADQQGEVFPPQPTTAGASARVSVSSGHRRGPR
jgi:hypothetical protein